MDISTLLKLMVTQGASDLYFSVGAPVHIKIEGITKPVDDIPIQSQQMNELARAVMDDHGLKTFESTLELNSALSVEGVGRFRMNVFKQRGETAMVIRYIKAKIPAIESLGLPLILKELIIGVRGLILVVGGTSSGKSTTLASMIEHRNETQAGHILLIEDPIEFVHEHKKSIVNQREVGIDTLSFENALYNAMREAPDVIVIGEIRDPNTMKSAISYAETGHLCLATLHANNANQALDRIIHFFPEEARASLLLDLSLNLKAIISLRLVPGVDHKLLPAVEVLLNSPYIADRIEKGKIEEIRDIMAKNDTQGMQTFDQALYELFKSGKISEETAIRFADSQNNVALKIRLSAPIASEASSKKT